MGARARSSARTGCSSTSSRRASDAHCGASRSKWVTFDPCSASVVRQATCTELPATSWLLSRLDSYLLSSQGSDAISCLSGHWSVTKVVVLIVHDLWKKKGTATGTDPTCARPYRSGSSHLLFFLFLFRVEPIGSAFAALSRSIAARCGLSRRDHETFS